MITRGYTEVCPPLLFRLTNPNSGSIMSWSFGLVAQLGAHHIRIVGVGSSNLLKSTNKKPPGRVVFLLVWYLRRGDSKIIMQQSGGLLLDTSWMVSTL